MTVNLFSRNPTDNLVLPAPHGNPYASGSVHLEGQLAVTVFAWFHVERLICT